MPEQDDALATGLGNEDAVALFRWLAIPRYVTVTAGGAVVAVISTLGSTNFDARPVLYIFIPVFLAVSAAMHVFAVRGRFPREALRVQLLLDLIAVAIATLLTGGATSPFAPLFFLVVISAGLVSARTAYAAGVSSVLFYAFMVAIDALGAKRGDLRGEVLTITVFTLMAGLIAFQSSFYFKRIKQKDEEILKLKDEFMFRTIHDVRSPSTVIKLVLDKYQHSTLVNDNPEFAKDVGVVAGALERILGLVNELLKIASGERADIVLKKENVDVPEAMASLATTLGPAMEKKKVAFAQNVPANLPRVTTDPEKLKEVLNNFLDNAVKYNKDGGKIEVTYRAEKDALIVEVADTGLGISEKSQEKMFAPYFRGDIGREIQGTGLGLFMTKKLLAKLGGTVALRSVKGEGSTFTLRIPLTH